MTQTVHTPSPELFMAMPEPDEAEFVVPTMAPYDPNPLDSIADSLRRIEARLASTDHDEGLADTVRQDLLDLEAKHATLYALLEEIEGILKPSTSKLANSVREAITRWRAPEVPEPAGDLTEPTVEGAGEHPSHDAPVEEWREYARDLGYGPVAELEKFNRSQIRSLLGIEQPGTPAPATVVHEASA